MQYLITMLALIWSWRMLTRPETVDIHRVHNHSIHPTPHRPGDGHGVGPDLLVIR